MIRTTPLRQVFIFDKDSVPAMLGARFLGLRQLHRAAALLQRVGSMRRLPMGSVLHPRAAPVLAGAFAETSFLGFARCFQFPP